MAENIPSSCITFPALLVFCLLACRSPENASPPASRAISVSWEVIDNLRVGGRSSRSELTWTNNGPGTLQNRDWTLYFNFIRAISPASVPDTLQITHINGDFYKLEPTESFVPLEPGQSYPFRFDASNWVINRSEAPSGFCLVFVEEDQGPLPPIRLQEYIIKPFTTDHQLNRSSADRLPAETGVTRFQRNQKSYSTRGVRDQSGSPNTGKAQEIQRTIQDQC